MSVIIYKLFRARGGEWLAASWVIFKGFTSRCSSQQSVPSSWVINLEIKVVVMQGVGM